MSIFSMDFRPAFRRPGQTRTVDSHCVIPREGRYVIAARGPNETFRDAEPYWFVSVSLDGEPSKRLMLTNDNARARSETAHSSIASGLST